MPVTVIKDYHVQLLDTIKGYSSSYKWWSAPLNLGGAGGESGGSGAPVGGIFGQLVQSKVAYDTTEIAYQGLPVPSGASLIDNLAHIRFDIDTLKAEAYITISGSSNLANERVLTPGSGILIIDEGDTVVISSYSSGSGGGGGPHFIDDGATHLATGLTTGDHLAATSPTTFAFSTPNSQYFTGTEWTDLTDSGETTLHSHAGGGAETLDDLTDVTISGPFDGWTLFYDTDDNLWHDTRLFRIVPDLKFFYFESQADSTDYLRLELDNTYAEFVYHQNSGAKSQIRFHSGGIIVNDAGLNFDFRVESEDEIYMLKVDGAENKVSIGRTYDSDGAVFIIYDNDWNLENHADITRFTEMTYGPGANYGESANLMSLMLDTNVAHATISANAHYVRATMVWDQRSVSPNLYSGQYEMKWDTSSFEHNWYWESGVTGGTITWDLIASFRDDVIVLVNNVEMSGGLIVGNPTGGDKGVGTINVATDIYKNDVVYTDPDYVLEHYYKGEIKQFINNLGAKEYKGLKTIDFTAKYMEANFQLPWIDGDNSSGIFSRSDMLLEGQETLMLYIIELEKRIAELEK